MVTVLASLFSRWNGTTPRPVRCLPVIVSRVTCEAVINFLALLGWNPGNDQELMSLDELVKLFDLHRCSKAGAKFDFEKGKWFNHEYILKKSNEEVAGLFMPILKEHGIEAPMDKVVTVVGLMKDRVSFIKDLWETCKFFFVAPTEYDEKTRKKNVGKRTLPNVCWSWRTYWRPWTTSRWRIRRLWS